jgi:hypothetical protein
MVGNISNIHPYVKNSEYPLQWYYSCRFTDQFLDSLRKLDVAFVLLFCLGFQEMNINNQTPTLHQSKKMRQKRLVFGGPIRVLFIYYRT